MMPQENPPRRAPTQDRTVLIHQAGSWTEAVVIRGLLESAGIQSPAPTTTGPFPMRQPPAGFHDVEIIVLESRADEAREWIADYLVSDNPLAPDSGEGGAE